MKEYETNEKAYRIKKMIQDTTGHSNFDLHILVLDTHITVDIFALTT